MRKRLDTKLASMVFAVLASAPGACWALLNTLVSTRVAKLGPAGNPVGPFLPLTVSSWKV